MLKNYFKIALRNLFNNKFYSAINILGLAIGISSFLIIGLWVKDELSYEKHFKNYDRIYRLANDLVTKGEPDPMACAEPIIADQLRADYPQVENVTRILPIPTLISYKDQEMYEEKSFYADTTFFSVFNYEFVKGSPLNALHDKEAVVLTENMASRLFGNEDPIGKTILINNSKTKDTARARTVTGIIKDHSHKSHFYPEVIIAKLKKREMFEYVYVLFKKDYTAEKFKTEVWPKLFDYWKKDYGPDNQYLDLNLQPLKDIHLDSDLTYEIEPNGNRTYVYIFSVIGLFILLIACINYMNLSTARSYNRSKEVGMRKVLGASKQQLIVQFLVESVSLTFLALLFALAFVEILLPPFNVFAGKTISLDLLDISTIITVLFLALLIGIISGSYPAFFISSFMPIKALKGSNDHLKSRPTLRKGLVILQFSLSIIMIIATMIVSAQLDFVKSTELGFNKEKVILVQMDDPALRKKTEIIKSELLKNPDILQAAASFNIPGGDISHFYYKFEQPTGMEPTLISTLVIDYDYIDLMKLKMLDGTSFSKEMVANLDSNIFVIVNESAAKSLKWQKPVGKIVHSSSVYNLRKGVCVGVVKDFHIASLHETIPPVLLALGRRGFNWMSIRINGKNTTATISYIEKQFKSISNAYPFNYSFLDDNFNKQYNEEEKRNVLFTWFAGLCIFISCLGLMGLASFATQQRTKEIGVRKISGASVGSIVFLLSKDFIQLVIIAIVIAIPIAYYLMAKWLQNFAYHTTIGVVVFIWSGLIAIFIALCTISFHTVRAANQNLTEVLKNE